MSATPAIPLFVDLDGTLIKSDSLVEMLLKLARQSPLALLLVPVWLLRGGKAGLKSELAERVRLDPALLPYDQTVIDLIKRYRQDGSEVVLATASIAATAQCVADHLRLFDAVIASDRNRNLKGREKLLAIEATTGKGGAFAYVGNDASDVEIWEAASKVYVVNAGRSLTDRMAGRGGEVLGRPAPMLRSLLKAMRVHQWLKNLLLFGPLVLAHKVFDIGSVVDTWIGFFAFSFCASGVYLLNDMLDIDSDRSHPTKKDRPFASGRLPVTTGALAAIALTALGLSLAAMLPLKFLAVLLGYLVATNAYSFRLKRVIVMDVVVLAGLYTTRIIAGSAAIDVPLSFWLLSYSMFLFLSLALVKRYSEILNLQTRGGQVTLGRGYSVEDIWVIGQLGSASGLISVLVLALYVNSNEVSGLYDDPRLLWFLCPLMMYWIGRMWILAARGQIDEDPVVFAAKDRRTYLIGALCALTLAGAMFI